MIPLMEMLMQSGNSPAMAQIADQFGLTKAQAEQAAEALMPAFSQGLKRQVADPAGLFKLMTTLASSGGGQFDQLMAGAKLSDGNQGEAILGQLFGSKDLSRAVAAQAAHATGLSQSILKQMLPILAPILIGGLFKQLTSGGNPLGRILEQMTGGGAQTQGNTRQAPQSEAGSNPWGQILEEMMRGGQKERTPGNAPGDGGGASADNPLGRILEEIMGGGRWQSQPDGEITRGNNRQGDNALGEIFNDMLKGGRNSAPQDVPEPEMPPEPMQERNQWREPKAGERAQGDGRYQPSPDGSAQPQTKGGLEDLFGRMFETGRETQNEYQRGVEQIFEQFMGAGKRR